MHRVATCLLCLALIFPAILNAKDPTWHKLQSEHFELYTADSERKGREILEHLEIVRAAYETLTGYKDESKKRGRVVLFRGEKEYAEYAPGQFSAAYYSRARGSDYVVISDFTRDVQRILNHEYFHLFSAHGEFRLPLWLEEGLADYYSTLQVTDKEIQLGHIVPEHLQFLNSLGGKPIPLARIFEINHGNRYEADRRNTDLLYAQGWALVHMTFMSPEMIGGSGQFFRDVRGRESAVDAYQKVYGMSLTDLDSALGKYVQKAGYHFRKIRAEGLKKKAPVEAVPLADWEVPLILADLKLYGRRADEAAQRLVDLSKSFPDVPEMDESLGYIAYLDRDRDKALEHFGNAVRKGSQNGEVYFFYASLGCDIREQNEDCTKWINESLRLNPTDRRARNWAINYALNQRRFEHALIYMVRSGTVEGDEAPHFFERYAYALAHLGKFEDARKAIQRGIGYARKPGELERLEKMSLLVDQIEATQTAGPQSGETIARTSVAKLPKFGTEHFQRSENAVTPVNEEEARQVEAVHQAAHAEARSPDFHFQKLLAQGNADILTGSLRRMDCTEGAPMLEVEAAGQRKRVAIDDPADIQVFLQGQIKDDHQFSCGEQKGESVIVGFVKEGAPNGTVGFLRILSFQ